MRQPNEIDFWRGFALVSIFVNHIPDNVFERLTHRNLGLSDSAELFVFLAGWSMRRLSDAAAQGGGAATLVLRLLGRGLKLHGAQILLTVLALALLAAAAIFFDAPLLLEWHNAASFFQSSAPTVIGVAMLTHQLGYFDILPLYVLLMHAAPIIALLDRFRRHLLLPVSLAVYATALILEINVPTWPDQGRWFFNPLSWQLIFVLGFVLASPDSEIGAWARAHSRPLRWLGAVGTALGAVAVMLHVWPDLTSMPWPRLAYVFNKTYLTPARLLHFLALVALFSGAFYVIHEKVRPLTRFLSMLGRNSLNVFFVASLLSLTGQIMHYRFGLGVLVDVCVIGSGIAILGLTAWLSELRERLRAR